MRTTTEHRYQCWCVLVDNYTGTPSQCGARTSGPDDPFCIICADRHPVFAVSQSITVTQQDPRLYRH